MPDIDDVLRERPEALSRLMEMAEASEPIGPDIDIVRGRIVNALVFGRDKQGNPTKPLASLGKNVHTVLSKDPEFAQKIWYNDFTGVLMNGDRAFTDTDATTMRMRVYDLYGFEPVKSLTDEVVMQVGEIYKLNPLQAWLNSLRWDGGERVDQYATMGLGSEPTDLAKLMCRKWLIQAVRRALEPGCKADYSLILVGPQGSGKSTSFKALAGEEWFSDTPIDIGDRRGYLQLQYTWVYELSELQSIRTRENDQVKAFLTSQEDTFVRPYGRYPAKVKRHTVFCGTTNRREFLTDPTGSRRYWVIDIGDIDTDWIAGHREQLWAEAVHYYRAGEIAYLNEEMSKQVEEANTRYYEEDPWTKMVVDYALHNYTGFSTSDIMKNALKMETGHMNRSTEMRVAAILGAMGFVKVRSGTGTGRAYLWKKQGSVVNLTKPEAKERA